LAKGGEKKERFIRRREEVFGYDDSPFKSPQCWWRGRREGGEKEGGGKAGRTGEQASTRGRDLPSCPPSGRGGGGKGLKGERGRDAAMVVTAHRDGAVAPEPAKKKKRGGVQEKREREKREGVTAISLTVHIVLLLDF